MEYSGQHSVQGGYAGHGLQARTSAPVPESPESPSRIRDQVGNSEQALSAIQESISTLERRLDTVLSPVPPQGNTNVPATSAPPCSHLTGRLEILNDGFANANRRLRDLAGRIEV